LYFQGDLFDASCDRVLRSVVWPLVAGLREQGLVGRAFFVRYADPRRHIRLRLLAAQSAATNIAEAVERAWSANTDRRARLPHRSNLRWSPYEREVQRYGGSTAMPVVERLFEASSILAERLLTPSVSRDRGPRLGRAAFATLVFLHRFLGDRGRLAAFAQRHAPLYLRGHLLGQSGRLRAALERAAHVRAQAQRDHITAILDVLDSGDGLPTPLAAFADEVCAAQAGLRRLFRTGRLRLREEVVADWEVATGTLAESLVHMTYNRLGVTRFEEALLALVLRESVSA
jgi:thiopeptide-type bacteriocin biosynthesis protein